MKVSHPFEWLSPSGQKRSFVLFFALTLLVMAALNAIDGHLKTQAAPSGIVSFEMAGNLTTARRIVDSWGATGRVYAGLSLGLDYLFLASYAGAISLGCVLVSRALSAVGKTLASAGSILAWVAILAALLDATENYGLIQLLLGSQQGTWAAVSRWCATLKFSMVALGLVYVIAGAAVALGRRAFWGK
jgi:hypothetical protein